MEQMKIGFVGFGEVNTPRDVVERKCGEALELVKGLGYPVVSTAPVADDEAYEQANRAIEELRKERFDLLVVCVAGWIPAHAVIKVVDKFRFTPMILWGLCGWMEGKTLVSTADQAGTTGLRHAFQEMGYELTMAGNIPGFYTDVETGKPGPKLCIMSELDALDISAHPESVNGMTHCCGHHAQGAAWYRSCIKGSGRIRRSLWYNPSHGSSGRGNDPAGIP